MVTANRKREGVQLQIGDETLTVLRGAPHWGDQEGGSAMQERGCAL